jgi:hypothetical protein
VNAKQPKALGGIFPGLSGLKWTGFYAKKDHWDGRRQTMKDRKGERMTEKKEVIVKDGDHSCSCVLTDISASGISVSTGHFIPTYKEIEVVMEIAGAKVPMQGSVRWSIDAATAKDKQGKMGIRLLNPPPAFLEYVKKVNG